MQTKFKETLEKQEQKWENMEKTFKQIQEKARKTDDDCESIIVGVIDSLQKHYCSVKEMIGAQEKAAAAQLNASLQNLQEKMEEMKKRDAELDQLAQNENNADFLQKWSSLRLLCEKDVLHLFQEVPEDPLLPFELTKTAVEELGRQLEEFCDKEFATIFQISLSGAEPETRADFLQYACELSLDSQTAHKSLIISEGDKKVMQSSQEWKSPAHPYPQRFVKRQQVLCKEGLQADRCYYEVEVDGDVVEIALAYKGIDRKSQNKPSAFGANTNSWSLDRSKTYSVSHKADSVLLTTPPRHPRIGVYLKFKEGTLSFYEVSDSDGMTFLYKVDAEFTEPLYAGFWLGDKCSIRICDLTQNRP
ncbi:tripartite motif-containing protein 16-like [Stegastes partitus]|uniref:Tripartite motif-containing protein 16-like n=1 Tax=Stegastes partitus TaxID=144197 RepID=A0A3B4ZQS5_9TELE|nr:PREDICTED: tripartite motif-containing protein 16-like [Stegastes partitus]